MPVYLCLPLSARCMALLWSFYPRQIPGNVGNFSQTLLVTVPRQLLLNQRAHTQIHTRTSSASTPPPARNPDIIDRHSPKSRHLASHAHTDTHPGELQGKSGISRNTLEKQEKTEGARCKIVLNKRERGGGWWWGLERQKKKVRLKQRHEATIERSTCQNSASVNPHIEEEQKCRK